MNPSHPSTRRLPSRSAFATDFIRSVSPLAMALALVVIGAAATGCGNRKAGLVAIEKGPPPVPTALLNAAYLPNQGLLAGIAPDGTPLIPPADGADPMMVETLRFYDTIRSPSTEPQEVHYADPFTGEATTERLTAPMTLAEWKRVFGFSAQEEGESVEAYRERTGIAVYYNRTELGLGRQLGCTRFRDGTGTGTGDDPSLDGVACFVTNHGAGFRQESASLQAAIDNADVRNTVCITYRPSMPAGYQVQFYVYGSTGARQEWARLDTIGPRPHPQVCTTCHGGAYDGDLHMVKNARFLPLDPALVTFATGDGVPANLTRDGQEERIRVFNEMATATPLTPEQQVMLAGLYPDGIHNPGARVTGDGVPGAWKTNGEDAEFYAAVVKPYCATCHLAAKNGLGDADVWSHALFATPAAFDATPLEAYVCNGFTMPNAQPTSLALWDGRDDVPLMIGGEPYSTAADALLARRGLDRSKCANLGKVSGCRRAPDPDALCGGAVSGGATCDLENDRCVPVVGSVQ